MTSHLTVEQRGLLESALVRRRAALDAQLNQHQQGQSRVDHARDVMQQDADDAAQLAADRAVDLQLSDLDVRELDAVGDALRRLHEPDFGVCRDCGDEIPFDRLALEPWTLYCIACATARERSAGHAAPARL